MNLSRLVCPLLLAGLLGCAATTPTNRGPAGFGGNLAPADPVAALIGQGQWEAAARLQEEKAWARPQGQERTEALLDSAWLYAQAGLPEPLLRLIGGLESTVDRPAQSWALRLLQARWHLLRNESLLALTRLQGESIPPLSQRWLLRSALTESQVQEQLMDGVAAVQALIRIDGLDPELEKQRLQALETLLLSTDLFWLPPGNGGSWALQGWLDIGQLGRRLWAGQDQLYAAMNSWHGAYPDHPAAALAPNLLRLASAAIQQAPRHVGLLLPLSGRLSAVAEAIRDGFLAAYYEAGESRLQISFFDTEARGAAAAFDAAIAAGCDVLIGPLQKEAVAQTLLQNSFQMPQLVLNTPDQSPSNAPWLLALALPPEDDAAAAAQLAVAAGHGRVAALRPEADWAQRSNAAFAQALQAAGGELRDEVVFSSRSDSYPKAIQELLQLARSEDRAGRVRHALGVPIEFELQRRQDIDALYVASGLEDLRQIRPQVRFYQGLDLPIYASGRIFDGNLQRRERDLDGVQFCSSPWLLGSSEGWKARRARFAAQLPKADASWAPFHALGHDAYQLSTLVRGGGWANGLTLDGASGSLLLQNGSVQRRLPCARYKDGLPELVSLP